MPRNAQAALQLQLLTCVHTRNNDQDDKFATLLLFRFVLLKPLFFSTATIDMQFDSTSNLKIEKFTPSGIRHFTPRGDASHSAKPLNTGKLASIEGILQHSIEGPRHLRWLITASKESKSGIPEWFNLAVLLKRDTDDEFQTAFKIEIDKPFRAPRDLFPMRRKGVRLPVVRFDPAINLKEDYLKTSNIADFPFEKFEYADITAEPERWEDAFFIELWNFEKIGLMTRPGIPGYSNIEKDTSIVPGVPCTPVRSMDRVELLNTYFTPFKKIKAGHVAEEDRGTHETTTDVRKLSLFAYKTNRKANNKHIDFFNDDGLQSIGGFFGLPRGYGESLFTHEGICSNDSLANGNHTYVVRTPRSTTDSWSLILICDSDFTNGAAIIRSDAGDRKIGETNISTVLQILRQEEAQNIHPLLLLRELLSDYQEATTESFIRVLSEVENVEEEIGKALEYESNSQPQKRDLPKTAPQIWWQTMKSIVSSTGRKTPEMDFKPYNLSSLSHKLYQAKMELVELAKRSKFESQVSEKLRAPLNNHQYLASRCNGVIESANRHRQDIKELPDRISGQTDILYSLIAQRDARLQYTIAKETVKDSKAMKTLAIITIVFLPGTFVAAIFSTDLAPPKERQGPIFAATVVPVTVVLIVAWILWIKVNPYGYSVKDIELGESNEENETGKSGKQD